MTAPARHPGPHDSHPSWIADNQNPLLAHTVGHLHQQLPSVTQAALCSQVHAMFLQDSSIYAIPVVDNIGSPIGLIERHSYIEYFSQHYSVELYGKKPIAHLSNEIAAFNSKPIILDAGTSVDDAAAIIIEAGMQHMVSGFIVTWYGRYMGIVNGHSLLNKITQRKQAELYQLAHYDQLTGIPNRMLFNDRIRMACLESDRRNTLTGLIFVDLDRFKQINDTMGHSFGDLLLRSVAERLTSCTRGIDTVARLGGDEFAILITSMTNPSEAEVAARRIVDYFRLPFSILDREIYITASLGIAIYPRDEKDSASLLSKADAAMYEAKQCGRNAFRTFTPGLLVHSMDHLALESDLRHAVARGELILHYQPQVQVKTGNVAGVEALLRWQHPERGMISPSVFIGIAEESGLIIDIGNWVLREACRQQQAWMSNGLPPLRVSVNISAVQFRRTDFTAHVRRIIRETGVDPCHVELELTESIAIHRAGEVLKTLQELKELGVNLAIDDFGTGFSNLGYLQRFPIDRLKIDQSFIRDVENIPANKSIIQAIVSLAHSLSLETVAEGVETETEFAHTRLCHCDEVQGFYHARPLPADDLIAWVYRRNVTPTESLAASSLRAVAG